MATAETVKQMRLARLVVVGRQASDEPASKSRPHQYPQVAKMMTSSAMTTAELVLPEGAKSRLL